MLWSPTAGDLDGDGTTELVVNTREGYTMIWNTSGLASANTEWWRYRHDERNTGRYGTDTRPPGILRNPSLAGPRTIAFTAPGDDWYAGQATAYRIVSTSGTIDVPATHAAGAQESVAVPDGMDTGTIQAIDDAGNLGRALPFDLPQGTVGGGQLIAGRRLALQDGSDPSRRRLSWTAKDRSITAPQGSDAPTVAGASLLVTNPTTGESTTLPMPAAGWTVRPNGMLKYSDPGMVRGPVRLAFLRAGRQLKVSARGSGIGFTLDEPFQQSIGAVLTSGGRKYCTLFGGEVKRNEPGRFTAMKAPPPAVCLQ